MKKQDIRIALMEEPNFKFEKLIIWQKAMDFGEEMNLLTKKISKGGLQFIVSAKQSS